MEEIKTGSTLIGKFNINIYPTTSELIKNLHELNNKCVRYNSVVPVLTNREISSILKLYPEYKKVSTVYYDVTWNSFMVYLSTKGKRIKVKLIKLLYEININKRLKDGQRVIQKNNIAKDINIDNLKLFDPVNNAKEYFKLDVDKLLEIYKQIGNFRFIGVFEKTSNDSEILRRRSVLLYNKDTNNRLEITLAKAKIIVKLNRLLKENETVDHIDRNYLNDNTDNLRVIDIFNHTKEDAFNIEIDPIKCPVCKTIFIPTKKQRNESKRLNNGIYCCNICKGKSRHLIKNNLIKPISYKNLTSRYYKINKSDPNKLIKDYFDYNEKLTAIEQAKILIKIVPINN